MNGQRNREARDFNTFDMPRISDMDVILHACAKSTQKILCLIYNILRTHGTDVLMRVDLWDENHCKKNAGRQSCDSLQKNRIEPVSCQLGPKTLQINEIVNLLLNERLVGQT